MDVVGSWVWTIQLFHTVYRGVALVMVSPFPPLEGRGQPSGLFHNRLGLPVEEAPHPSSYARRFYSSRPWGTFF